MRRLLIHLAVALVAFVVGVKLAWAFSAVFGSAVGPQDVRPVYAAPTVMSAPSCKTSPRRFMQAPVPPVPPAPPAAPKPSKQTRIVITGPDGTVQVIETPAEAVTKRKS